MPLNIFSRSLARHPCVMIAISWVKAKPAARLIIYRITSSPTRPRICPDTAAQLPLRQLCSTKAMTFCINTEGMELTTALMRIQTITTGSRTG